MIVIFPFEEEIYRRGGVDVGYFGHPLVHQVKANLDRAGFCRKHGLDPDCPLICLLPGSRVEEVNHVLPTLIRAAHLIGDRFQYLISAAPNIDAGQIRNVIKHCKSTGRTPVRMRILKEDLYDALKHSAAAAVCSGTATLEAALVGTPFVMVYRIAVWRWSLRPFFVDVPYYCIVNLIAGRQVVRELMQHEFTPERTAAEISSLTSNESRRNEMVMDFHRVRALLDRGDALQSAADSIMELLHSR
jgi:lipid-A-disaccharide synthase